MLAEPPTSVQEIGENLASIRGIGPNRADTFREAGFDTATDIWFASDNSILDVHGIGDRALKQIRSDIGSFDGEDE
jgi:predicted flap endonuclease-1-like 5' DNA nuclease